MKRWGWAGGIGLGVVLAAAGCTRPQTVQLAALPPLHSKKPVTVKDVKVLDNHGHVMNPLPPLELQALPRDQLAVQGMQITPLRNGPTRLTVKVTGTNVQAVTNVDVDLVNAVEVTCVDNKACVVGVGRELTVRAMAMAGGLAVPEEVPQVTSDAPSILKEVGPMKFMGVVPGNVFLRAQVDDIITNKPIKVVAVPDHLSLDCPPSNLVAVEGQPGKICQLAAGKTLALALTATVAGVNIDHPAVDWTTSKASMAAINQEGVVEARDLGVLTLKASVVGVTASLELVVVGDPEVSVRLGATCAGQYKFKTREFRIRTPPSRWSWGFQSATLHCETPGGVKCITQELEEDNSVAHLESSKELCCCQ